MKVVFRDVGTDVEQLRINWSAGEIQLRTNSRQDEQSNRDECGPHSSKRTEKRESTACSFRRSLFQPLFNPSASTRRSISFFFLLSMSVPGALPFLDTNRCGASSATSREKERERRRHYTFLTIQFDSDQFMVSRTFCPVVIASIPKRSTKRPKPGDLETMSRLLAR